MVGESILVTGAAGFIGSHLVERLLSRGDRVIGLDNFDPFYSPAEKWQNLSAALTHPAFRLVEADCAELEEVERALEGEPSTSSSTWPQRPACAPRSRTPSATRGPTSRARRPCSSSHGDAA